MPDAAFQDVYYSSADGLKLYLRDYAPASGAAGLPAICLPGLARTSGDFDRLARALAGDPERPRRVLALDYRGRGRSDRDPDWTKYDVRVELGDVMQALTVTGIAEAIFVGTSRGGLITMAMAAARPAVLRGGVLNDIGPEIEVAGLKRIKGYVGQLPTAQNIPEAAEILKTLFGSQFPNMPQEEWIAFAEGTWEERAEGLAPRYDPALLKGLEALDLDGPLPVLWSFFEALGHVPLFAIRGANSDLLSEATLASMARRHPDCRTQTVPDQGHAPLLRDEETVGAIVDFARLCDDTPRRRPVAPPAIRTAGRP